MVKCHLAMVVMTVRFRSVARGRKHLVRLLDCQSSEAGPIPVVRARKFPRERGKDMSGVLLINPKFPHNVGGALRACAAWGIDTLRWTGDRVTIEELIKGRLPREERMREYKDTVDWSRIVTFRPIDEHVFKNMIPICIELGDGYEQLPEFEHPDEALYVFGPEDGSVPRPIKQHCHRFVSIPTHFCLNLAAAINVVLYDRMAKLGQGIRLEEMILGWRT
jgi:tRNA(Leu) C34 or U34 (ribose-2'-O)-methylase TrmL